MGRPRSAVALAARAVVALAALVTVASLAAGCSDAAAGGRPTGDDGGPDGPERIEKPPAPVEAGCVGTTDGGAPCPGDSCGGVLKSVAALQTGEVAQSGPSQACPA